MTETPVLEPPEGDPTPLEAIRRDGRPILSSGDHGARNTRGAEAAAAAPARALRWLIVLAAMTGAVLEVIDTTITATALPQIQGNVGATLSEVGWVNTGYIIANVIVLPMAGWLSDRFGRSRYFAGAIALFTAASLMCGLSHSLNALIFWRVLQGLGGGGLLATGQVILLEAFPPERRGIATAIFGVGVMVGPLLGPVLGGWLTENYAWPWIFFINLPFGAVAAILTRLFVPDGTHQAASGRGRTIDYPGILLLAAGMGSLQTVLERGQEEDWLHSRLIVDLLIVAIIATSLFIWWELRAKNPVLDLRVLRNRTLAAGTLFGGVLGFGLYGTVFLLPVYQQNLLGYNAYESGLVQFPPALYGMVSFLAAGMLSQKQDARLLLALGTFAFLLCPWGLSHLTTQSSNGDMFLALLWRGLSLGFLFVPLTVASLGGLRPEERDTGSGLVSFMRQFGGSVGIATLSTLLTRRADFHKASLAAHVTDANPVLREWLIGAEAQLRGHGYDPAGAHAAALGLLNATTQRQAMMLSFDDCFLAIALVFLAALPLIALFRKGAADGADMGGTAH